MVRLGYKVRLRVFLLHTHVLEPELTGLILLVLPSIKTLKLVNSSQKTTASFSSETNKNIAEWETFLQTVIFLFYETSTSNEVWHLLEYQGFPLTPTYNTDGFDAYVVTDEHTSIVQLQIPISSTHSVRNQSNMSTSHIWIRKVWVSYYPPFCFHYNFVWFWILVSFKNYI